MNKLVLNTYLQAKDRFLGLPRDKKYIFTLLVITLGLILYFLLLWYPLYSAIQALKEDNAHKQELLLWISQASAKIVQLKSTTLAGKRIVNMPILTIIDQEAKTNGWSGYPLELKSLDNQQVEASFKAIAFDDLLSGLTQIWTKYNIKVVRVNLHRSKDENLVSVNLILK